MSCRSWSKLWSPTHLGADTPSHVVNAPSSALYRRPIAEDADKDECGSQEGPALQSDDAFLSPGRGPPLGSQAFIVEGNGVGAKDGHRLFPIWDSGNDPKALSTRCRRRRS